MVTILSFDEKRLSISQMRISIKKRRPTAQIIVKSAKLKTERTGIRKKKLIKTSKACETRKAEGISKTKSAISKHILEVV